MTFRWATVTDDDPLRIRLDGDVDELPFEPESLVDPLLLTVADRVRCEISRSRVVVHGRSGGDARIGPIQTNLDLALALGRMNMARNAKFRINQKGSASGASLASGAYFLDGWKSATASHVITWTGSDDAGRVLTLESGKYMRQVVERRDVIPGDALLVWKGTARARTPYNVGGSTGSLSPSGQSGIQTRAVTLDGAADVNLDLQGGTVEWVALVPATLWSGVFPDVPYALDLVRCQRYYYRTPALLGGGGPFLSLLGYYVSTTVCVLPIALPVPMRATPTLSSSTVGNLRVRDSTGNERTASNLQLGANQAAGNPFITVEVTTGTTTSGAVGYLRASVSGAYIEFSAEL